MMTYTSLGMSGWEGSKEDKVEFEELKNSFWPSDGIITEANTKWSFLDDLGLILENKLNDFKKVISKET